MEDVAEKYGCQTDHSAFNAFVMIVMSHGEDNDCILGVNGRKVFVKDLMVQFQEVKCPSLKEKPKVCFFPISPMLLSRDFAINISGSMFE